MIHAGLINITFPHISNHKYYQASSTSAGEFAITNVRPAHSERI